MKLLYVSPNIVVSLRVSSSFLTFGPPRSFWTEKSKIASLSKLTGSPGNNSVSFMSLGTPAPHAFTEVSWSSFLPPSSLMCNRTFEQSFSAPRDPRLGTPTVNDSSRHALPSATRPDRNASGLAGRIIMIIRSGCGYTRILHAGAPQSQNPSAENVLKITTVVQKMLL